VEAHADVMRGRLCARVFLVGAFVNDELQCALQRGFKGCDVHFTVSLAHMAVSDLKQCTRSENRKVQRGARDQFFVVHIARMKARGSAINAAELRWRGNTHAAEKRMQWNLNPRSKLGHHALFVQRDNLHLAIREVLGKKSARRAKSVVSIRNGQIDLLDSHLKRVSRLSLFDVDRSVEYVSARTFVCDFFIDVAQALLHLVWRHSRSFEAGGAVCDQRVELNPVSRMNTQHRLCGCVVVAPRHCLGGGRQRVKMRYAGGGDRLLREQWRHGQEQKTED